MRKHRVEEIKTLELAVYLNTCYAEGRTVLSILDGPSSRSTHVLVVSYKDDGQLAEKPEFVHEQAEQKSDPAVPPAPAASKKEKPHGTTATRK